MTQEYFNSILVNNYEYDKFKENYKLIEEEYSFFNDQFGEIPEEFFKQKFIRNNKVNLYLKSLSKKVNNSTLLNNHKLNDKFYKKKINTMINNFYKCGDNNEEQYIFIQSLISTVHKKLQYTNRNNMIIIYIQQKLNKYVYINDIVDNQ